MTQLEWLQLLRGLVNHAEPPANLHDLGLYVRNELAKLVPEHTPMAGPRYRPVICSADELYRALIVQMSQCPDDIANRLITFLDKEARYAEGATVGYGMPDGPYCGQYYL